MPAAPPVTTGSFQGVLHPADVARVLNLLVGGAPFCSAALTPYPTTRHAVAFPTAKPDRPQWLKEMDPLPVVGLGDDADIVATCKLASIVLMSNESAADAEREPDPGVRRPAPRVGQRRAGSWCALRDAMIPSLAGWWRPRCPPQAPTSALR